jgi:hypothetical protein
MEDICFLYVHEYYSAVDVIKGNEIQIPQVVKLWVERYEKDPKQAMVELLTTLFEVTMEVFEISSSVKHRMKEFKEYGWKCASILLGA